MFEDGKQLVDMVYLKRERKGATYEQTSDGYL
jgi:hypothetical protein